MIRDQLADAVEKALAALGVDPGDKEFAVERPARREHGDWSTNAALVCAKAAGRNPRELGQALADHLLADRPPHVEAIDIAGPGFVNFTLAPTWLHDVLTEVVAELAAELRPGDLCMTLGAGDLTAIPDDVLAELRQRPD